MISVSLENVWGVDGGTTGEGQRRDSECQRIIESVTGASGKTDGVT